MSPKSEDPQNPEEPVKADEPQKPEERHTFFRFLPANPTKEQWEDFGRYPWFYNWMDAFETEVKPATYAVYCSQPPEPQGSNDSGSTPDTAASPLEKPASALSDSDEPAGEAVIKPEPDK
jgi:hypothetical protein